MDALTIIMIIVFSIAALVPTVWAIVCVAKGKSAHWATVAGAIFAFVTMAVLFIGMASNWYGCCSKNAHAITCVVEASGDPSTRCPNPNPWPRACGDKSCAQASICTAATAGSYCPAGEFPVYEFCEEFSDGKVKQPWATWSDISFIAAGLWILWWLAKFGSASGGTTVANPMRTIGWLSLTYALIVIFMGPGSMYYHASMKNWGGYFDSLSVVLWLGFNAAYVWHAVLFSAWDNLRGVGRTIFVLSLTALFLLIFGISGWLAPGSRLIGYLVCGGLWGVGELVYWIIMASSNSVKYKRTFWLFGLNLGILAVTMTIWVFFNPSIELTTSAEQCRDRQGFPGHALFHILASFATLATFASFVSEKRAQTQA